ncbi:hypothetical protein PanWU01x14_131740 [Parasponia andersonii]|uniref:Uncharacterized protein n=1 Tax=Parasponia andersonii TaxID=3476 RepID=A0A2P5CR26_PARAD|nr:hypothetical protein PanWU01x14_131740 [Parasponia andersonii]
MEVSFLGSTATLLFKRHGALGAGTEHGQFSSRRKDADHHDKLLACGTVIVAELRMKVLEKTEFTCSAGIAHNMEITSSLARDLFLGVSTVGDLLQFLEEKLQECYGINIGTWLWNIARGIMEKKFRDAFFLRVMVQRRHFLDPEL